MMLSSSVTPKGRFSRRTMLVLARVVLLTTLVTTTLVTTVLAGPAGADTLSRATGQGSTYAANAFGQWIGDTQKQGLNVNYTATNSPSGLQAYANNTADFAGTEAEYSEILGGNNPPRGFEYTPDVAGATAIMYHVQDGAERDVNYLHLSRLTVAKIFMGIINNWNDPAISADNKGLVLPNHPITVVGRSGQSGTTALFYDFVQQTDPGDYARWAAQNGFNAGSRILEIDSGPGTGTWQFLSGSDQEAQQIASPGGEWSIGYDEFSYAKVYNANVAWIQNASGNYVQPYPDNITAALASAVLAPDTSQNLNGVYASTNPAAYPISAYSYILVQCGTSLGDRPTCVSPYSDPGIMNTMAQFMRYVACGGQVQMPVIGYAALPPLLSQFLADAIARMTGQPVETLTQANCANPEFNPNYVPAGSPTDPEAAVVSLGTGAGGGGTAANNGATSTTTGAATTATGKGGTSAAVGRSGSGVLAIGGGSGQSRAPAPKPFLAANASASSPVPLIGLLLVLLVPLALFTLILHRRRDDLVPAPSKKDKP
jgi:phosphate transport system substrate-binding protein